MFYTRIKLQIVSLRLIMPFLQSALGKSRLVSVGRGNTMVTAHVEEFWSRESKINI